MGALASVATDHQEAAARAGLQRESKTAGWETTVRGSWAGGGEVEGDSAAAEEPGEHGGGQSGAAGPAGVPGGVVESDVTGLVAEGQDEVAAATFGRARGSPDEAGGSSVLMKASVQVEVRRVPWRAPSWADGSGEAPPRELHVPGFRGGAGHATGWR